MPKPKSDARAKTKRALVEEPFFRPFSKMVKAKKAEAKKAEATDAESKKVEADKGQAKKSDAPARQPSAPVAKHRSAPPAPAPRGDARHDADTFALHMAGVRALDGKSTRIPLTQSRVEQGPRHSPTQDLDKDARAALSALVTGGVRFEMVDDGERIEGRRLDTDPRDLRRLRRGAFAVDGKLDLHGLGAGEARAAVEAFVKKRAASGDVAVIVVHGKGTHSPRGLGILRGEIAAWLSQGSAARHVKAFSTAPEDDGGEGAVLVLLAR